MGKKSRRGMMTEDLHHKAIGLLGITINQQELRLMPYLQYCLMNGGKMDHRRINADECAMIENWEALGLVTNFREGCIAVSKKFWDAICELMWLAYADHNGGDNG